MEEVSCRSVAQVVVPKYRIGNNLGGKTNADVFILFVSVKPADLSREKMMALACRLAQIYEAFDGFFLMVFEEHMAAVLYDPSGVDVAYPQANSKIRATYDVDNRKDSGWFKWFAEGGDWVRAENVTLVPVDHK